ncbi:hypothetical protein C4D60_Mb03t09090 [Musa balbisiana]|uniref:Uncharacterized protein n=1 Tax=Musa balbisiana TaxID=52838 RepID=A0A4S8J9N5_MUSBA|nr:hypothetical protein C4D60_Mb03t09090 [Musa balbisiana]
MGSLRKSDWNTELIPIDIEIMSTPSSIASSIAFITVEPAHPPSEHALYTASLLEGEPPLATPCARP